MDLSNHIGKFKGLNIAVIGDIILDRYIFGNVGRISPEAPVPIVEETKRESRLGGAANVLASIVGLEANGHIFGIIGDDIDGLELLGIFHETKINTNGLVVGKGRRTTVKSRVISSGQQMIRIDGEVKDKLTQDAIDKIIEAFEVALPTLDAVLISDYGKGVIAERLLTQIEGLILQQERKGHKCPLIIDPHPSNMTLYRGAYLVKPNRHEAELVSGMNIKDLESAKRVANLLTHSWRSDYVLITLGSLGMVCVDRENKEFLFFEAKSREVFDVSGAGDCVTAILGVAIAAGMSLELAGELANFAAGIVISEVGTAPITVEKLLKEA
jgi:rfaE bifunctional protein kinase chain/domain